MANFIFQVVKLSETGTKTTFSWNQRQISPHSKRTLFWAKSIHMTKSASKLTAWHATQQDCNMCKQDRDWFKGLLCPNKHPMSTHICVHHLDWAGIEIETMSSFLLFKSKLEQKQTKRNISNLLSPLQSKAKYIWIYCNLASTFKSDDSFSSV